MTAKRTITAAACSRQERALELRKAGLSYEEIAEKVGYSNRRSAHQAVTSALRKSSRETTEEVRLLELERLNRLLVSVWSSALKGDEKSIDRALKILERRGKLLGLDGLSNQRAPSRDGAAPRSTPKESPDHDIDRIASILAVLAESGLVPAAPEGTDSAEDD
ncbi:hypothetical protein Pan216_08490 [Planctomycetes bacterium Pan216]|uniref:Uncharacterized protein n=1 Tax=Kolteria novifilia TaxID=2527975 RepID=A0A518AZ83_9BACT|nr:hypothetical protein Pan216_08490 [Planctomycetes bacterium Pan216]